MDSLNTLQGLGLTLPTPAYLFGLLFFGIAGYALFRFGSVRVSYGCARAA